MNFFHRANWKYIAIVVVFALLAVGGVLLLQGASTTPTTPAQQALPPAPQAQTLDTSTWQTYRNEEFGFEVKYPGACDNIEENLNSIFSVLCTIDDTEFIERVIFFSWGHIGFSCESLKECESNLNFDKIEYTNNDTAILERMRNGNNEFVLVFLKENTPLGNGIGQIEVQQRGKSDALQFEGTARQILSTFRFIE